MNKYYTPTIEEFCIGFQYQVKGYSLNEEWTDFELNAYDMKTIDCGAPGEPCYSENQWEYILEELEKGNVRVKYLNQEDFEELDWKVKEINDARIVCEKQINYIRGEVTLFSLVFVPITNWLLIWNESSDDVVFAGEIKNKLEFKKLLNQLKL